MDVQTWEKFKVFVALTQGIYNRWIHRVNAISFLTAVSISISKAVIKNIYDSGDNLVKLEIILNTSCGEAFKTNSRKMEYSVSYKFLIYAWYQITCTFNFI
jgi:hypothetical protein